MNNPNPTSFNVIETIGVQKFQHILGSLRLARKVALDQVAYENEARRVKSLKIQAIRRCNKGTIVDGRVKNLKSVQARMLVIETSVNSWLTVAHKKDSTRSSSI